MRYDLISPIAFENRTRMTVDRGSGNNLTFFLYLFRFYNIQAVSLRL